MDIYSMTRDRLAEWFRKHGENPAKAAIMFEWLYQRGISEFRELPFSRRVVSALESAFTISLMPLFANAQLYSHRRHPRHHSSFT